ncbi:putative ABC-type nitrate transporter [Helianthus annuus]|uniref:Nitrate-transporting ATPase n=1 Tax=Helianthus annuus TaxID=4232 RepID=A0A251V5I8_HELAN|nr:protein NRT1/ PTR FAMILY 6.4 [Helianthus annuus]KAF5812223.1 putative nitrate-transporting ATPase [Helianthus annuus]KAJ0598782.1 putative ABC-type nitrate transporter [Helianthus annuus]KAJ0928990.1 putative ABC-type nitrate transporter [Helianthus annuus]
MVLAVSKTDNEDAVDFRGNPVDKSKTGGWLAAGLILGTELSERICVMGISMNLVTYLVGELNLSSSKSANTVTNFMGALNILALFGGFLADAKLGRYLTIAIFASICAVGVTLLTLATTLSSMKPPHCNNRIKQHCIEASGSQLAMLYLALYTIALGGGGIKSNVSGFGSDQFDISNPKEEKAMVYFFNRFYFCISLGSLFAVTVLVYIQDNVGRGWGYGISAGTMIIAVIVLICGTAKYRFKKPQGSPLTVIWRVVFLAIKNRNHPYPANPCFLNEYGNSKVPHTTKFRSLDKAAILIDYANSDQNRNNPWLVSTVTQVEEVKMVISLIPIWSTCILFWTVYSQMNTFTIEQATIMNRKVANFSIPAGSFSVFLFISILLFTSLNESVIVRLARKITHDPKGLRSLQRVGIGLVLSVIGMVASAIVEKKRRETHQNEMKKLSAFWLVPQFFLVGAGEAFAYVGQLEFFIREAPERMKSMSTGLFLSTLAMGYFMSSVLVTLTDMATNGSWLTNDLNKGKLENFYWLLAILGAINFLVFLVLASRHRYKVQNFNGDRNDENKDIENWKISNTEMVDDVEAKKTAIEA